MKGASGSEMTRARRNRMPRAMLARTRSCHSGSAGSGTGLPASQSRKPSSRGVYASRISRCTADAVVSAINSLNGGTMAIERLLDDLPHPRGEPDYRLVVGDGAVLGHICEHLRVGDRPALEDQVAGLVVDEHGRAVVSACVRVDACED